MRDEFTPKTKEIIAKRAGYRCSNPDCRISTVGAALGHDGVVNIGVAAHITAASPGGPRYNPTLTSAQRKSQLNGIWTCQNHGKEIDSDSPHFTVEILRNWKQTAEANSFRALNSPYFIQDQRFSREPEIIDDALIEQLGLTSQDNLEAITLRLKGAAKTDIAAFKRMQGWTNKNPITLNLTILDGDKINPFTVFELAEKIEVYNDIAIVAPPGTGKTTTMLQMVEAILLEGNFLALFIPLSEWASQTDTFFQSIMHRHVFTNLREEYLKLVAHLGRLVFVMDGWNELDTVTRKRAYNEIRALKREFPNLGLVISTRRQVMDIPISAQVVEIDALTQDQQLEIARALKGDQGEVILDHAWRTPGIRELVEIPLYLTTLLIHTLGDYLPTTKEEVLRLFVNKYENDKDKAEALYTNLFGFHTEILTALAVEATVAANTSLNDRQACSVIKRIEDQLVNQGQLSTAIQPIIVLNTLIDHHLLIRSSATKEIIFQHQQFQEWYTSFEVEKQMMAMAENDQEANQKLRVDMLNIPIWEESILFACERVSRRDRIGSQVVAAIIFETLAIDPMFASEMIYRSSDSVWNEIKEKIITFIDKWHTNGRVDRAVNFMISTGRKEFAEKIWPLISNTDDQIHLAALRTGHRFRPSVLGDDIQARIAQLPEEVRMTIIDEIAGNSGMDGIELASRLALIDVSPKVKFSAIEALHFRRADRFVIENLKMASSEVWSLLVSQGSVEDINDRTLTIRMKKEQRLYITNESDPLRKLRKILQWNERSFGKKVCNLIEAEGYPIEDRDAGWAIHDAYKQYPKEVITALLHRIESGYEILYRTVDILKSAGIIIDKGPIVDYIMNPNSPKNIVNAAVCIVGPKSINKLIDKLFVIDRKLRDLHGNFDQSMSDEHHRIVDLITETSLTPFIQAVLRRSMIDEPREIALLGDLIARHGKGEYEEPLELESNQFEQMITTIEHWAEILLSSSTAERYQFADIARVIKRLATPKLLTVLHSLLKQDLTFFRRMYDKCLASSKRGKRIDVDLTIRTIDYRQAFIAIGNDQVIELMKTYLRDCHFSLDAAYVLKSIWYKEQNLSLSNKFKSWPDFSEVMTRRKERQNNSENIESSPLADLIFVAIDDYLKLENSHDSYSHALKLAQIAFSMPYSNRGELINTLLQLQNPLREKQNLFIVLILAGEIISADLILDGIKTLLEEAKTKQWLLNENQWELDRWLEIIPFSDRPGATLEALELLDTNQRQPKRLHRLLLALGYVPSLEAENLLKFLAQSNAEFLNDYNWFNALVKQGTFTAARILLELICEGAFTCKSMDINMWTLSKTIGSLMQAHPDFRTEVYNRYKPSGPGMVILENAIAEVADTDGVILLIQIHAIQGKSFNSILSTAIRNVAIKERPSMEWMGTNELLSVPIPELRRKLFSMIKDDTTESKLAASCLNAIDELRDDYGQVESEPRHPDINSGRPWPLID